MNITSLFSSTEGACLFGMVIGAMATYSGMLIFQGLIRDVYRRDLLDVQKTIIELVQSIKKLQ